MALEEAIREGAGEGLGDRLRLDGPDVRLAAETAVNVLLAVHELASNAREHGALSAEAGGIDLEWTVHEGRMELAWTETGGPPPAPPERQGFGLRMLLSGLPRSFGGVASVDFPPAGLRYAVSAPLSAAIRPGPEPE